MTGPRNIHGTAIMVRGLGILIRGPARSGKSALALSALRRAEALGWPCGLVADDQVLLDVRPEGLLATAPGPIAGLIEVSGVGILPEPEAGPTLLRLVADLCPPDRIERLPEAETQVSLAGVPLRRIALPERQAAFAADVLHSLVPFLCAGPSPSSHEARPPSSPPHAGRAGKGP